MTTTTRTGRAMLIASLLGSVALAPAHADVTASEVWEDWKANMGVYGASGVTVGDESMSGDTLTVSGVSITVDDPEADVSAEIGELTFTELGDGTVRVGMPQTIPMTLALDPEYGEPVTLNISLVQEGVDLVVGGTPEEMTYDVTAARYTMRLDGAEGDTDDVVFNAAELSMADVAGTYVTSGGENGLRNVDYVLTSGVINVVLDIEESGDGTGTMQFLGTIDGLDTSAVVSVPAEMDMETPETALADGLSIEAGYTFGSSSYTFAFTDDEESMQGQASAESGAMQIAMDAEGFSYEGGATAPQISFRGGDVPFPVDVSLAEYGYGVTMPLSPTEEPQPFGLTLLLSELAVNEEIWSMIDPGGLLSHDPATLSLDIGGQARILTDMLDAEQMENAMTGDELPAELHALEINDLTLRIAGAEVLGEGSFTFDNTDTETFGGAPAPRGEAELRINGANQLIDKLVQMGLIPEEQVMGARMMMGMFANAVGDDQLVSRLEINDQNHVIVNGQRIQ